jgi:hypothetical protein
VYPNACQVRITLLVNPFQISNHSISQLFLNDPSETPVATFHCKQRGFFTQKRPASVEIFPPGEHMVELILVTLLYAEKLRQDKVESSIRQVDTESDELLNV